MVDIGSKIDQIKKLVDNRCYFTINRARQYGKTTTLACLERKLRDDYIVVSISFEGIGDEGFESPEFFCRTFMELIQESLEFVDVPNDYRESWVDGSSITFRGLSRHLTSMCRDKKIVLMIDEVDKTSNNRTFIHFLGMLRDKFLARKNGKDHTFHSVILAGVYDIKNIKLKMVNAGTYTPAPEENRLFNSPWNIAVNFNVDMSFNPTEIASMLLAYESDHHTGMDITTIAQEVYNYTSGYPFLVSRICQCLDEELGKNWTLDGVQEAVKILLDEKNTLFDDVFKNLEAYKELYDLIYSVLILGEQRNYVIDDPFIELGATFGFLKNNNGKVAIANKIFEVRMANYFISKESRNNPDKQITGVLQYNGQRNLDSKTAP
ncbi:MAG: AAA-like domain-containing protein [Peptococcaceae bacterium]|nr:AAA-like domain-containing protein [Peptococcaceae bacterium]